MKAPPAWLSGHLRMANLVQDSIVDGPGLRLALFVQGCLHACPGCHNPDTHDVTGGREVSLAWLWSQLHENPLTDGLTLTGGEPFLQALPCARLAQAARAMGKSVWTYTGYTMEYLLSQLGVRPDWRALLEATDVLVDGPFILAQRTLDLSFRGSLNQRLLDPAASIEAGAPVLWQPPQG